MSDDEKPQFLREPILDMENWIRSRQKKGKTTTDIRHELYERGYDMHSARALVLMHWQMDE